MLVTKEMLARLPALHTYEGHSPDSVPVPLRIFNPIGIGEWSFFESGREGDDIMFFGWCSPLGRDCAELGYQSLRELESVRLPWGLRLEVDRSWACRQPYPTLADVLSEAGADGLLAGLRHAAVERRAAMVLEANVVFDRIAHYQRGGVHPSPLVRDDDADAAGEAVGA